MAKTYLISGGSGFIGSNLVNTLLKDKSNTVINIDKLTYASNENFTSHKSKSNYKFFQNDINDKNAIKKIILKFKPNYILHLAAESHVDRSIDNPENFIHTNILGTYNLLTTAYDYWLSLTPKKKKSFRFIMVSTDEVYGSLRNKRKKFSEESHYKPNSPYAASKASADLITRSWFKTYGFPIITTNTSNNYGSWQFPEKLIPLTINKCTRNEKIPVYGEGNQIRDWIHVDDNVSALLFIIKNGEIGEKYNIGSCNEITNINVVKNICNLYDKITKNKPQKSVKLIHNVEDRPGHDFRYAIDPTKLNKLGWKHRISWKDGLEKTLRWYLDNREYLLLINKKKYSGQRLGKIKK